MLFQKKDELTHSRLIKGLDNAKERVYLTICNIHKDTLWELPEVRTELAKLSLKDYNIKILTDNKDILPRQILENNKIKIKKTIEDYLSPSGSKAQACIFDNSLLLIAYDAHEGYSEPASMFLKKAKLNANEYAEVYFDF